MSRKFTDVHKAALELGFVLTPNKEPFTSKGPVYNNYNHPNGMSLSISVNRDGQTGPYGAKKKGDVNGFFLALGDEDTKAGTEDSHLRNQFRILSMTPTGGVKRIETSPDGHKINH